jgi:hypothetical protein
MPLMTWHNGKWWVVVAMALTILLITVSLPIYKHSRA